MDNELKEKSEYNRWFVGRRVLFRVGAAAIYATTPLSLALRWILCVWPKCPRPTSHFLRKSKRLFLAKQWREKRKKQPGFYLALHFEKNFHQTVPRLTCHESRKLVRLCRKKKKKKKEKGKIKFSKTNIFYQDGWRISKRERKDS